MKKLLVLGLLVMAGSVEAKKNAQSDSAEWKEWRKPKQTFAVQNEWNNYYKQQAKKAINAANTLTQAKQNLRLNSSYWSLTRQEQTALKAQVTQLWNQQHKQTK